MPLPASAKAPMRGSRSTIRIDPPPAKHQPLTTLNPPKLSAISLLHPSTSNDAVSAPSLLTISSVSSAGPATCTVHAPRCTAAMRMHDTERMADPSSAAATDSCGGAEQVRAVPVSRAGWTRCEVDDVASATRGDCRSQHVVKISRVSRCQRRCEMHGALPLASQCNARLRLIGDRRQ